MSLHGVKPLACSWPGCVIRARSGAELRSHLATHAQAAAQDGPVFACESCPFRGRTKQLLKRYVSALKPSPRRGFAEESVGTGFAGEGARVHAALGMTDQAAERSQKDKPQF